MDVLKDLFSFQKKEEQSFGQYVLSEALKVIAILVVMFAILAGVYFLTNWALEATIGRAINDWKRVGG
jgi:hypothetical protein